MDFRESLVKLSNCHSGMEKREIAHLVFNSYLCFCNSFLCSNAAMGNNVPEFTFYYPVLLLSTGLLEIPKDKLVLLVFFSRKKLFLGKIVMSQSLHSSSTLIDKPGPSKHTF